MRRVLPLVGVVLGGAFLGLRPHAGGWADRHDKLAHVIAGGLLAAALVHAFPTWRARGVVLACASGAALLEVAQSLVPGRTASVLDVLATLAGTVLLVAARPRRPAPSGGTEAPPEAQGD